MSTPIHRRYALVICITSQLKSAELSMPFKVADLCDEYSATGEIQICQPIFRHYGKNHRFSGVVETVQCFEDNSKVRQAVFSEGKGRVLVVDAAASQRCAMLGDILAGEAVKNHWSGILINGYIRDSADIERMPIGIRALGTFPLKSNKQGMGSRGVEVAFAGVRFVPGCYVYSDEDGTICSSKALL